MNIEPCNAKYYGIPCKKACCVVEEKMAARLQVHAVDPASIEDKCPVAWSDGRRYVFQCGHTGFHVREAAEAGT